MSSQSEIDQPAQFPTETLRVYLLGPPGTEWAGQSFSIFRRQARALLYHLAARLQPVPREHLCFLFWPDTRDSTARRNLTRLLTHLRRELPDPELLLTSRDQVALDSQRAWSDVVTFEQLCTIREPYRRIEALQQAVELYRGSFLAGFSLPDAPEFETWAVTERQSWERLYLEALTVLIEDGSARGSADTATDYARRYLAIDDLAEDMHRQLIELYAAVGDRSAALRQFERCVEVLERELGVDPLPETRAVYEAVLAGTRQPVAVPVGEPTWATLPGLTVPLVGRDDMLQRLDEAYTLAQSGQGGVALISGEAGIGKSRLVQDFAAGLQGQVLLLTGAGYPEAQTMPYQPIVEALRSILHVQPSAWKVPPIWLAEASRLLPELHTLYLDLPLSPEADPSEARARLFEALSQLTLGLAVGPHPVLLCLDDVHWADGTTLDWLTYLARQLQGSRVLVMGTYRSEEADAVSQLRHGLNRLGVLSELQLTELDTAAVLQVLQHLNGTVLGDEAVAQRLQQATGGNPFFLMETLRALLEAGQLTDAQRLADPADLPISKAVQEAVKTRLDRVSPKARQILEAAAVLSSVFGFDLMRQTAGRSEMETIDGLDELVDRQLLEEEADRYRFHHALIRTAVYRDLSSGRRRLLHRRCGEVLEKLRPDVVAALARPFERFGPHVRKAQSIEAGRIVEIAVRLARHFFEAGEIGKAAHYLLLAGDRTRGLYAHQEAIVHYQRALALLQEQGDYERSARTSMKLGLTYHNAFNFRQARQTYEQGFSLWERANRTQPPVLLAPAPQPLRVDWYQTLTTLDPTMAVDFHSTGVIDQLFSGLVEYSPEMEITPDVAHSWEILDEGRTYMFHLRDDVCWSDGAPVTARDFEYAWKRALTPNTGSPAASLLYDIKGAQAFHQGDLSDSDQIGVLARDPVTLVVELAGPTGYFLQLLAYSITYPLPRHAVKVHDEAWAEVGNIVTNGPFRLEAWQRDESIVLSRNPTYHGQFRGNLQHIELSLVTDSAERLQMYEAGDLDVLLLWHLQPAEMDRARQQYAGEYISGPFLYTSFGVFDVSRSPFDDPRSRQAFVHAIDREALADVVMRGTEFPALGGLIPPGMPDHSPEIGLSYDRNRARQLLTEAGYSPEDGTGFPVIELLVPPGMETVSDYLQAQWWESLKVDTTRETADWAEFFDRLDQVQPQIYLMGWAADYPDPDSFLRVNLHTRCLTSWPGQGYRPLVERARRVMDQAERLKLYRQADRILGEEAMLMPLTYGRLHMLHKPWVRKYPVSPLKWWFFKDVILEPH